ncbi:Triacylglycerol lipase [Plesiocystis pacifica SIR-1]|uniref:Triacylglycerol lipase n=1 Tax=Plesiocystis pacifica SIR-1 TaxID=391625 RepID=A6G865_9BACT|nr:Triacylglycerol lipase [Plesiocystis pacifica SIR-1]
MAPACSLLALALAPACADDSVGGTRDDEIGAEAPTEEESAGEDGESGSESGDNDGSTGSSEGEERGSETGTPCDPSDPNALPWQAREFLAKGESRADVQLGACDYHVWWVSAATGVETTITVSGVDEGAGVDLAVAYPDAPNYVEALATASVLDTGELAFEAPRSGEFAVLVRAQNPGADPQLSLSYDIEVACTNQCQFVTTRFPMVFVHGWTGFENIGPLTYFYNVREDLEALGYPVAIAVLDPYNSVDVRGEQLVEFVTATLGAARARKVNLIGHSQGGIDSRYVAADAGGGMGAQVSSVITIGTPHYGTPVPDIALGLLPGASEVVLAWLFNFLGATMDQQSDVLASLDTLSEAHMIDEFNPTYLDHPEVQYWSWAGETCVAGIGCQDTLDPLLLIPYELILPLAGDNDGLVPTESAKWGEYLGLMPADHIDQIGQIAGVTGLNYDHIQFFRDNAEMLVDGAH